MKYDYGIGFGRLVDQAHFYRDGLKDGLINLEMIFSVSNNILKISAFMSINQLFLRGLTKGCVFSI